MVQSHPFYLINTTFALIPTRALHNRRLAFRDIYGQLINSVQYTFPFHGRVYRQYRLPDPRDTQSSYEVKGQMVPYV